MLSSSKSDQHAKLRRIPQIYQVHIADGFSSDCDELVHRCLEVENLDFQEFSKIWKEMNFDLLYHGRSSGAEIAELSEELIHIAKHYMVKDTSYYAESMTGLFLVYGLVTLQPFAGFACLRLIPQDLHAINRLEMVARRERKLDVLYILGEVLVKWTQYHADERPRGMESVLRKYLEGYTSIDKLGLRPMGIFYRQSEDMDHIRDIGALTRRYTLAKKTIKDGSQDPCLQYINENLTNELSASLRKVVSGMVDDADDDPDGDDDSASEEEKRTAEDRSNTLHAIKLKAMSQKVDSMKHLVTADDRKKTKTSPKTQSDLKKTSGKIKTGTLTKPVTTSPKKQKYDVKMMAKPSDKDSDDEVDLIIEDFHIIEEGTSETTKVTDEDSQDQGINITTASLPLIMRTGEVLQNVEIEIIDQSHTDEKDNKDTKKRKHNSSKHSDNEESPKSGKKVNLTYEDDTDKEEKINKTLIKKREKREQKRRDMQSHFKKLGLLSVANFKDQNEDDKEE